VKQFEQAIQNVTADGLTAVCGDQDFQSIETLAKLVVTRLSELVGAAVGVLNALACETLVPLYVSLGLAIQLLYSIIFISTHLLVARTDFNVLQWHMRVFSNGSDLDVCILSCDCRIWNVHDYISHRVLANARR